MNSISETTYLFGDPLKVKKEKHAKEECEQNFSKLTLFSESLDREFVVQKIRIGENNVYDGEIISSEKLKNIQKLVAVYFSSLGELELQKIHESDRKCEIESKGGVDSQNDGVAPETHLLTRIAKLNDAIRQLFPGLACPLSPSSPQNIQDIAQPALRRGNSLASELQEEKIEFTLASAAPPREINEVADLHTISQDYLVDERNCSAELLGEQIVTRTSTLETALSLCENTISWSKTRVKTLEKLIAYKNEQTLDKIDESIIAEKQRLGGKFSEVQSRLGFYQKQKENITEYQKDCEPSKKGWLSSEYFRDWILKCIKQLTTSSKVSGGFKVASEGYIAVPPNMRQQTFTKDNVSVKYGRTGVISDMRNGWISYQELEGIVQADPITGKIDSEKINRKLRELDKEKIKIERGVSWWSSSKTKKNYQLNKNNQLDSVKSAIDALENLEVTISTNNAAVKEIKEDPKKKIKFAGQQVQLCDAEIKIRLRNREIVLEQQMMVYLQDQFASNPEYVNKCLREKKPIDVVHVGLLNMGQKKTDETGWRHDEQVQMEDMSAIFKKFHGKKLIFAQSGGPLIKGDTLVFSIPGVENGQGKLGAYFFNTSVEGDCKNSGPQHENNKETVGRYLLTKFIESADDNDKLGPVVESLSVIKKTSYDLAVSLIREFRNEDEETTKAIVSFGGLSATNRTGVVGEKLMQAPLKKALENRKINTGAYFRKHLFKSDGPAIQISRDNLTPHSALKTNSSDLPIPFHHRLLQSIKALGRKIRHGAQPD